MNHYDRGMAAFDALFVPAQLRAAVSSHAWLEGMLEAERALATAGAAAGVVPADAAAEIAAACDAARFDPEQLAEEGRAAGNPAEPLVRALAASVGDEASRWVHRGATSQDVVDTAAMLVAHRALSLVLADADRVAAAAAGLAREHRDTPMAARTLLQHAVPTTFGLKASGWLAAVVEARTRLAEVARMRLAAQLGGAAGTLAAFGDEGVTLLDLFAGELGLHAPVLPWHTDRTRIAELGAALATAAGVAAKIALDVILLAQTEVGEVAEGDGGRSSTMPQKRNPSRSALARAAARLAEAHASVLTGTLEQEHERAAGAWQAEWDALSGALAYTGGALSALGGRAGVARGRRGADATQPRRDRRPRAGGADLLPPACAAGPRRGAGGRPRRRRPRCRVRDELPRRAACGPEDGARPVRARGGARPGRVSRRGGSVRRPRARALRRLP